VLDDPPTDPWSIDPEFPHDLARIIQRGLEKNQSDRFSSARAMREAIERVLEERSVSTREAVLSEFLKSVIEARSGRDEYRDTRPDNVLPIELLRGGTVDHVSEPKLRPQVSMEIEIEIVEEPRRRAVADMSEQPTVLDGMSVEAVARAIVARCEEMPIAAMAPRVQLTPVEVEEVPAELSPRLGFFARLKVLFARLLRFRFRWRDAR
jgi:hypothetical protein